MHRRMIYPRSPLSVQIPLTVRPFYITHLKSLFRIIRIHMLCPFTSSHITCSLLSQGPFEWYEVIKRQQTVRNYVDQFNERYTRFVAAGYKHAMIVACEPSEDQSASITSVIGFIEVGQLPSPINSAGEESR